MKRRDISEQAMQMLLCDLKIHLRITSNEQDVILYPCASAALRSAEHHIGRCLLDSTITYEDKFSSVVALPYYDEDFFPIEEVVSVKVDGNNESRYSIAGGTLTFEEGVIGEAISIIYRCGGVPMEPDIKAAIMLTASKFFNNPVDSVEALPSVAGNLLRAYRKWGVKDGE